MVVTRKQKGGIFNNVPAKCLPADMVDHLSESESSREYFPNLRQAGWMTKPFPRIFSASNLLTLFYSFKINQTNQPTNQAQPRGQLIPATHSPDSQPTRLRPDQVPVSSADTRPPQSPWFPSPFPS